jgi:hypothetical protein
VGNKLSSLSREIGNSVSMDRNESPSAFTRKDHYAIVVYSGSVNVIMKVVRNTVEGVKFTFPMMVCSALVAVWHYECHQLIKEIRKGRGKYNSEKKKNKIE